MVANHQGRQYQRAVTEADMHRSPRRHDRRAFRRATSRTVRRGSALPIPLEAIRTAAAKC